MRIGTHWFLLVYRERQQQPFLGALQADHFTLIYQHVPAAHIARIQVGAIVNLIVSLILWRFASEIYTSFAQQGYDILDNCHLKLTLICRNRKRLSLYGRVQLILAKDSQKRWQF
jgi:hypothetical protein